MSIGTLAPAALPRARWCGWPGLAAALLALLLAVCGPWLAGRLDPPAPPLEDRATEVAGRIWERVVAKRRGQEAPAAAPAAEPLRWSQGLTLAALILGVAGCACGILGLVRREDARLAGAAVAVGVGAVLFQYAILIAAAVLFLLLVALALSAFVFGAVDP